MAKKASKSADRPSAGKPQVRIGKLSDFRPQSANANQHTERGLRMLDDSMSEDGYVAPMTAVADNEVIDGSARLERAFDRFSDEAIILEHDGTRPIITKRVDIPDADNPMARRIALRANRIAEADLSWNPDILAQLVESDPKTIEGMFSDKELAEILTQTGIEPKDAEPQIDKAEELRQKWGTETGQLWVIGNHRLLVGDATNKADAGRVCANNAIDLVMADPPYGIKADRMTMGDKESSKPRALRLSTGQNWDAERPEIGELVNVGRYCCVWGGQYFCHQLPISDDWLCWHKKIAGVSFAEAELAWTNYGTRMRVFAHHWSGEEKKHITQKPLPVTAWAITMCPDEPQVIYDPFVGSGTTLVAAENLNRKCYAIEISPAYAAVCLERMTTAFPHLKIERPDRAEAA